MKEKVKNKIDRTEQIYQLTTLVAGNFSLQEVLDKLAEAAVRITGVKACSIRLLDEQAGELKMRSTFGLSEDYRSKGDVSKEDTVIKAAFEGQAVILDDMRLDDRVKYKEAAAKEGLVSQLTVAMKFRENAIGVLRLYSPKPRHFGEDDIALARAVASQCAIAITNATLYAEALEASRITEQMRLAGAIQRRMIPQQPPKVRGLDIDAAYIPCFDVGGDLYDFYVPVEGRIVLLIADVVGKGIPAAMMMSHLKGAISAYTDTARDLRSLIQNVAKQKATKEVVRRVVGRLNYMACSKCREGEFITLFYAVIDVNDKTLTYCNCGHEPPILIKNQETIDLEKGGLVLGIMTDNQYELETLNLQDGDSLLFYTDGLIDAANFNGELWARQRLLDTAKEFNKCSAKQMLKNILAYRRRFVGLARQIDDTSIVIVKVGNTSADCGTKGVQ